MFQGVVESLLQILCITYIGNIFFANVLNCSSCPFLTKVCDIVSLVLEGVLAVGTVVWAHTSKIRYYKGFVSYKGTKLHVDLYDGDKFLYELKDASRKVIPDVPPKAADIKRGTRVIAKFKNMQRYYSSTVMEVDASDASEPRYHVRLDDGEETWDSLYHLRLLPKEVQIEGNLVVCFPSLTHFLVFLFCCTLLSRDLIFIDRFWFPSGLCNAARYVGLHPEASRRTPGETSGTQAFLWSYFHESDLNVY